MVFYQLIILKQYMSSKHSIPGHKIFRRTSKSPWQQTKNAYYMDCDSSFHQQHRNLETRAGCQNSGITTNSQFLSASICSMTNSLNSSCQLMKKAATQYPATACQKIAHHAHLQSSPGCRTLQPLKVTYIPIESMTTIQSLPASNKKIVQINENKSNQKRNCSINVSQQLENTKKQLQRVLHQNRQLLNSQRHKSQQNHRLIRQIQLLKNRNMFLQYQVSQASIRTKDMENRIKSFESIQQNLKKQLLNYEESMIKAEDNLRLLHQNIRKLENQNKLKSDENKDILKLLSLKDKQLIQARNELRKSSSSSRSLSLSQVIENRLPEQSKVLKQNRSILQQNNHMQSSASVLLLQKNKIQSISRSATKCNRFIQTDSCKLQELLKENERYMHTLEDKESVIGVLQAEIQGLNCRLMAFQEACAKIEQLQTLVEFLNTRVVQDMAYKLSAKYKYY